MPWVRLDEDFPEHPKVEQVGPLAGWMHICAIAYCNRNLTDGFVPTRAVGRLANFDEVLIATPMPPAITDMNEGLPVDNYSLAVDLCDAGMWERVQGGYLIHNYLEYQPSREKVEAERAAKAEAGRKGGIASGQSRNGSKNEAESKQTTKQDRSTRPTTGAAQGQAKPKPVSVPVSVSDVSLSSPNYLRALEPQAEEEMKDMPETQRRTARRLGHVCTGRRTHLEAVDVVRHCCRFVDWKIVDEQVGFAESTGAASMPRAIVPGVRKSASSYGIEVPPFVPRQAKSA